MGQFTIALTGTNQKRVFKTNLSAANSNMFSHWGTNINGSKVTSNSVTVQNKKDYDFLLKAFTSLANIDGNSSDLSDADFKGIKKSNLGCGNPKIKANIWHSDEPQEYNFHEGKADGTVGRTIWLSNHTDDGV